MVTRAHLSVTLNAHGLSCLVMLVSLPKCVSSLLLSRDYLKSLKIIFLSGQCLCNGVDLHTECRLA